MVAGKLGVTLTGPKGTQAVFPMNFMGWVDSHSYFTSVLWGSFCLAALWEMEKKTLLVPKCANLDGPSRTCIPQGLVSYQAESKKRNKAREVPSVLDILIKFLTLRNWAFELLPSRCSHALHQRGCRCQIRCSAWKPRRNVGRNCRTARTIFVVKLFKPGPISNRMLSFNMLFSLFSSAIHGSGCQLWCFDGHIVVEKWVKRWWESVSHIIMYLFVYLCLVYHLES